MYKDVKKLVEGYEKCNGSELKIQKNPRTPVTTLSKSDLEEPCNINKYRSFVGKLMCYTTKLGPDMANGARELVVQMSHFGPEHWKALVILVGYLKGKDTKVVIIRKLKVLKAVIFVTQNIPQIKRQERV